MGASTALGVRLSGVNVTDVLSATVPAMVYSRLTASTYEVGRTVSDDMMAKALLAASESGSFEADGQTWTIVQRDGTC